MTLSASQKRHLRGLGHGIDPVVMIGQHGLTAAVVAEMDVALTAHELVKVRARVGDRERRQEALSALAEKTASELVHCIGNVGLFYRQDSKLPKILLPDS